MHVTQLRTLGGIAITRNLDEQRGHGGAEVGFEQQVEDLAALRFRIVLQQNRGGAAAADRANPVKSFAGGSPVEKQGLIRRGG